MEGHRIAAKPAASEAAFTLFELLLVLVIVGLSAAVAVPRWVAALPGVQLTTAARKTASILRYAGQRAVAEQRLYRGVLDIDGGRLSLEAVVTAADDLGLSPETSPYDAPSVADYRLPAGVTISRALDGAGNPQPERLDVYFFPGGGNSGGWITMANDRGRRLVLAIDFITGAVKVESPDAS